MLGSVLSNLECEAQPKPDSAAVVYAFLGEAALQPAKEIIANHLFRMSLANRFDLQSIGVDTDEEFAELCKWTASSAIVQKKSSGFG